MYTKVRVQELIVTTAWIRVLHYFMKFPNSFINDVWTWRNTRILLSLILWWVIQSGRKQKLLSNHTYHSVILTIMGGGVLLCVNLEFWLTFKYQQTKVSQWIDINQDYCIMMDLHSSIDHLCTWAQKEKKLDVGAKSLTISAGATYKYETVTNCCHWC